MSHNTEESEDSPESPYFGEIKHVHVPGAPPFFACQAQGYSNTSVKIVQKMKYRDSSTETKLRK